MANGLGMIWPLALAGLAPPDFIEMREPEPPSTLVTQIVAQCARGEISIRYVVRQPGPNSIEAITVAGVPLTEGSLVQLERIVGSKSIDGISIVHCDDDEQDPMSARLLLEFGAASAAAEGSPQFVGIVVREGQVRIIGDRR